MWQELDAQALAALQNVKRDGAIAGVEVAEAIWKHAPQVLLLGSSNIVRDFDLAARPASASAMAVYANRGLAGIDGTISTALGLAQGSRKRTLAVMGDITFAHDASSLSWTPGETQPQLDIVVYNDGGGAIFSTLEHGAVDDSGLYGRAVERLFATPQHFSIPALAEAYGWQYARAATKEELSAVLGEASPANLRLIEVPASRASLRAENIELNQLLGALAWPAA